MTRDYITAVKFHTGKSLYTILSQETEEEFLQFSAAITHKASFKVTNL